MNDNRPDLPWKEGGARAIDFVAKNGGNPVMNPATREYHLPTGARMSADGRGLAEPPTDPLVRLHHERLYFRLLTERTRTHLDELAAASRGDSLSVRWRTELYGVGPASLDAAHKRLTKLLADQRRALAKVEAELREIHAECA